MTISKKQRMLHLINQFEAYKNSLPKQVVSNLAEAKEKLHHLDEATVERLTDKVVSVPATEQTIDFHSPENLIHSCYDELNIFIRENNVPDELETALREMRYYFTIAEHDGYFPE